MKDNSKASRERRKKEALERQERYSKLSWVAKVEQVKTRRGGSKKELARIQAKLEADNPSGYVLVA